MLALKCLVSVIIFMFYTVGVSGQEPEVEYFEIIGKEEIFDDTSTGAAYCKNGFLSREEVSQTLLVINNRRAILASGLLQNISKDDDGYTIKSFPPAKSMKKMTYDCVLEQEANEFLVEKTCLQIDLIWKRQDEEMPDRGFVLKDYVSSTLFVTFWTMDTFSWAVTTNKSVKYHYDAKNMMMNSPEDVAFAINLLLPDASEIGCASMNCRESTYYFCMTHQKNIHVGEDIYEIAERPGCDPLISNADPSVTSQAESDVDPGVTSQAEFPGSDPESSTWCVWEEISDTLREQMRDTHNFRRTTLALGQITDNTGTTLPPATNMNYLNWNCTLENEAHDFLRNCPKEGYQRPNDDLPAQNFYRDTITSGLTYRDMHKKAVTEWWKPVRKVAGPGTSVIFLPEHNNTTIKSFTLMGWASTKEIGCSIAKCGNEWVEACRYYPPGNEVGEQMYRKGKACSECEKLGIGRCDPQLGLCVSKK